MMARSHNITTMGIRRPRRHHHPASTSLVATMSSSTVVLLFIGYALCEFCNAFTMLPTIERWSGRSQNSQRRRIFESTVKDPASALYIYAPPGSGYMSIDDEESELPDSYEPMMEYPGTMRPGKTPENMPFHDLPIGDDDPEPIPWPHFQQIEWHHKWEPPHPHPIPIEDFIEQQGRWATPEMEAAMRAGARRGVKERREAAESEKKSTLIVDDDDDDEASVMDVPVELGDGVYGTLGSVAEDAVTAEAVKPPSADDAIVDDGPDTAESSVTPAAKDDDEEEDEEDDSFDDFLLDLGLDMADDDEEESTPTASNQASAAQGLLEAIQNAGDDIDDESSDEDVDIDLDLDLGFLDDDGDDSVAPAATTVEADEEELDLDDAEDAIIDDGGVQMVPLDDLDDDTDSLDGEDDFDDGGFDYDDGDLDTDGGDVW